MVTIVYVYIWVLVIEYIKAYFVPTPGRFFVFCYCILCAIWNMVDCPWKLCCGRLFSLLCIWDKKNPLPTRVSCQMHMSRQWILEADLTPTQGASPSESRFFQHLVFPCRTVCPRAAKFGKMAPFSARPWIYIVNQSHLNPMGWAP